MENFIWMNGAFIPESEAKVSPLTHTLHYSVGVFEGLRIYLTEHGPAIFKLKEHTQRLFQSAEIMGMQIPYTESILNEAQIELIRQNGSKSTYIRPLVFYGAESLGVYPRGLKTNVLIATTQWDSDIDLNAKKNGVQVYTSTYTRTLNNNHLYKAKATGNYLISVLALQEAQKKGFDKALLLDSNGQIAEGSAENIFLVRNQMLYTPSSASVLEGITRQTICTLAQENGFTVHIHPLTLEDVYQADEAFFTGTAAEITPIIRIDKKLIGQTKPGPITQLFQKHYSDAVLGKNKQHLDWLTFV